MKVSGILQNIENKKVEFNREQNIIYHLMIKSVEIKDIGLFHGKMGIALVFYELSRKYNNEVYSIYADELLDQIIENIHNKLPIDFESGLSGIGWGIEYLIKNKFIEASSIEVCEEIDIQLMSIDIRRIQDLTIEKGLCGILNYIVSHIQNCLLQESNLPFDKLYLDDLYQRLGQLNLHDKDLFADIFQKYLSFYKYKKLDYQFSLLPIQETIQDFDINNLGSYSLGLRNGLAGYLINQEI